MTRVVVEPLAPATEITRPALGAIQASVRRLVADAWWVICLLPILVLAAAIAAG